jgi:creatinine amidohydrolase
MKTHSYQHRKFAFEHARPDEILKVRKKTSLLWLPVGPIEWHGPHLPFGVDPLNAEATCFGCAKRIGGLVLPTLYSGTERERTADVLKRLGIDPSSHVVGMDFPKHSLRSGYFPEEQFALHVRGWIERAIDWKFRTIVIINGHGATNHKEVLHRMTQHYGQKGSPIQVLAFQAYEPNLNPLMGHATVHETSLMMLDFPGDVSLSSLPPKTRALKLRDFGIVDDLTFTGRVSHDHTLLHEDDPRFYATTTNGKKVRELTVRYVCGKVQAFLQKRSKVRTDCKTPLSP